MIMSRSPRHGWSEPHPYLRAVFQARRLARARLSRKLIGNLKKSKEVAVQEQGDPVDKEKEKKAKRYHHVGSLYRLAFILSDMGSHYRF